MVATVQSYIWIAFVNIQFLIVINMIIIIIICLKIATLNNYYSNFVKLFRLIYLRICQMLIFELI